MKISWKIYVRSVRSLRSKSSPEQLTIPSNLDNYFLQFTSSVFIFHLFHCIIRGCWIHIHCISNNEFVVWNQFFVANFVHGILIIYCCEDAGSQTETNCNQHEKPVNVSDPVAQRNGRSEVLWKSSTDGKCMRFIWNSVEKQNCAGIHFNFHWAIMKGNIKLYTCLGLLSIRTKVHFRIECQIKVFSNMFWLAMVMVLTVDLMFCKAVALWCIDLIPRTRIYGRSFSSCSGRDKNFVKIIISERSDNKNLNIAASRYSSLKNSNMVRAQKIFLTSYSEKHLLWNVYFCRADLN